MSASVIICHSPAKPLLHTKRKATDSLSQLLHEVKNPLCNIYLACDMLKMSELTEEQQISVSIIVRASWRINDQLNTILCSPGINDTKYELYPLRRLLDEVLSSVEDHIFLRRIEIARDYGALEDNVLIDVAKMKLALTNIIVNAIEASPLEEGVLKLVTRATGETSSMEIQDNGRGIILIEYMNME
jgi:two-component system, sensor histidine kinase and response regulator